jgi:hypothetical protein
MSALGQKQTLRRFQAMSVLPPKADIAQHRGNVRFVPKAGIGYSINSSARSCSSREIVSPIDLIA